MELSIREVSRENNFRFTDAIGQMFPMLMPFIERSEAMNRYLKEINMNLHHLVSTFEERPIVEDPRQSYEDSRGGSTYLKNGNF